ncbi:hypothetical protein PG988_009437 [Apiospora saccharicola]
MDYVAPDHATAKALVTQPQYKRQDPESLEKASMGRIEYEAWVAAGSHNMEAPNTLEPVQKTEFMDEADVHLSATLLKSTVTPETSEKVLVDTAFGAREAIVSTPLPADKSTVLGGGPLVEFTFDKTYREEQKAYMAKNGLKGLSASRWA